MLAFITNIFLNIAVSIIFITIFFISRRVYVQSLNFKIYGSFIIIQGILISFTKSEFGIGAILLAAGITFLAIGLHKK